MEREEKLEAKLGDAAGRDGGQACADACAVSSPQLAALQSRLEAMHAAKLLSDAKPVELEDLCCDVMELETMVAGGQLTIEMATAQPMIAKALRLLDFRRGWRETRCWLGGFAGRSRLDNHERVAWNRWSHLAIVL